MSSVRRLSAGRVTADFFTASYRFSASVIVYNRRLIDVLSDPTTNYLDMVDIYISRINNPGDIVATYQTGTLIKEEINFLMLASEAEGTSKQKYFGTRENLPIFLSIPSFEIQGQIQWGTREIQAKKLLAPDTHKFLPVLNATASNSLFPEVTFQGPMALVNKPKIQVVCSGSPG